ncbi:Hypothetical predicted protein [Mytilus galloprovincialis]|uniref:Amino acid transporter transmembrane domain-containing protein n=1 Tax=Mytilus galloprovincialis TaxID=29158 RepID=A0A8B6BUE8_MYTGA|nr:Hypothetical predicted protein [Mytilus galloprovincialis]
MYWDTKQWSSACLGDSELADYAKTATSQHFIVITSKTTKPKVFPLCFIEESTCVSRRVFKGWRVSSSVFKLFLEYSVSSKMTGPKGLTVWTSSMFIIGAIAGIGVLSLPKAVEDTGWIGLFFIFVFIVKSAYTATLIGKCWVMIEDRYPEYRSHVPDPYPIIGEKAFGTFGRYIGIGATISTGIACVLIVIQTVMDKHEQPIVHHSETSTLKIFTACGKMVFAVAGHSIFPTIITDMKKKNDFYKSALLGYGIVLLMYLPTALSGYLAYGRDVNVNVLKSLSVGNLAHITEILITVHLLFGFVIFMNPICQQFEAIVGVPEEFTWKRCVVRPIIVLAVLFVSESVPHFGTVLSLVGGSATTLLAYVFPCVFYMKLCRDVNEELKLGPHHVINKEGTLTQKSIEYSPLLDHLTGEEESEGAFECEASEASSPASSRTRISEPIVIPMWQKILNTKIVIIGILGGTAATVSAIIDITNPESLSVPCYVSLQGAGT